MDIIYFPFFHRKFADGVRGETTAYIGTYMMLLCRQAEKGRLKETPQKLARWIGGDCTPEIVQQVLDEKFKKDDTGAYNQVLENVLEDVLEKSKSATAKALKRWATEGTPDATAMPQHNHSNAAAMPQHSTGNTIEIGNRNRNRNRKGEREKAHPHPTIEEVMNFFQENGKDTKVAKKAFKYYQAADWHDKTGTPVKNWKQTMIGVWFDEPQNTTTQNGKTTTASKAQGWANVGKAKN